MTNLPIERSTDDELLLRQVRGAERSDLPTAVTQGKLHLVHYANEAFARLLGRTAQGLRGVVFDSLTVDRERAVELFGRALRSGVVETSANLAYTGPEGKTLFAATLVQRLEGLRGPATVVHTVDTTLVTRTGSGPASTPDLVMLANEQLVLGSLREQALAEVTAQASIERERLLRRQSLLAGASALLSSSLSLAATLRAAAGLALPELAECGIIRLLGAGSAPRTAVAHLDSELHEQLARSQNELANDSDLAALEAGALQNRGPFQLRLSDEAGGAPREAARCLLRKCGAQSGLAIPLAARGAVIGVLFFVSFSGGRFEPSEVEFAQELGRRAGRALDNAQLFHDAQQAARMREDVLAIVSHDLCNPLGAISMTAQHLLGQLSATAAPKVRGGLELIHRAGDHMRRMIDELLEVANIQAGHLALQYAQVSVGSLVGRGLEMFERASAEKGVRLASRLAAVDTDLPCDVEKVVRVIANLLGNAIKFTPRGGSVEISSFVHEDSACISVRDTGPGIAKEEQSRLFEQYWKGDQAGRIGMGLGLYIARGIVDAHHGRIWVESEPPHGSAFIFALPLVLSA